MFDGKMKALTFSYDDGVGQDVRLIEIFNKYGLKGTFNLNSKLLGRKENKSEIMGKMIDRPTARPEDVKYIYEGHEVAAHTLGHPLLPAPASLAGGHPLPLHRIHAGRHLHTRNSAVGKCVHPAVESQSRNR